MTYLVAHQAVDSDIDSEDDDTDYDKNKWQKININLIKDFEKFNLHQMKGWAEDVWKSKDAELATANGQSTIYTCRAFAEFIFASIVPSFQKSKQNSLALE